jgi:hypothetical protein
MFFDLLLFDKKSVDRAGLIVARTERPLMQRTGLHRFCIFSVKTLKLIVNDQSHAIMFFDLLLFDEKSVVRAGLSVARSPNVC